VAKRVEVYIGSHPRLLPGTGERLGHRVGMRWRGTARAGGERRRHARRGLTAGLSEAPLLDRQLLGARQRAPVEGEGPDARAVLGVLGSRSAVVAMIASAMTTVPPEMSMSDHRRAHASPRRAPAAAITRSNTAKRRSISRAASRRACTSAGFGARTGTGWPARGPFRHLGVAHRIGQAVAAPLPGESARPVEDGSGLVHARTTQAGLAFRSRTQRSTS
jgi:hypothetical protein